MDFLQAEREYLRLKAQYQAGQIIVSEFEKLANALMVQDSNGCVWQQGITSGKWYRYEKGEWHEDIPSEKQQSVRWAGAPIPSQPDIRMPVCPGEAEAAQLPPFPPETLDVLSLQGEAHAESQKSRPAQDVRRHVPVGVFVGIALLLLALILYLLR